MTFMTNETYTNFCIEYFDEENQRKFHLKWFRAKPADVTKAAPLEATT